MGFKNVGKVVKMPGPFEILMKLLEISHLGMSDPDNPQIEVTVRDASGKSVVLEIYLIAIQRNESLRALEILGYIPYKSVGKIIPNYQWVSIVCDINKRNQQIDKASVHFLKKSITKPTTGFNFKRV